jgi:hypothetical protein
MQTRLLVAVLPVLVVPTIAHAQRAPVSDSMPGAGTWAAEAIIGSGASGASLLRFQSARTALLLGADFNVFHQEEDDDEGTGVGLLSGTTSTVNARLGVRSYRQSDTDRLRPILGFGARGGYSKSSSNVRGWTTGVYGELGAVYFVTPHLSLGGTGELQANYGKQKLRSGATTTREVTLTSINGSLIRVMLSVYF